LRILERRACVIVDIILRELGLIEYNEEGSIILGAY
jgi:hypothetical protein